jgi:hypothetical protein
MVLIPTKDERRMSSLEEVATPPRAMESEPTPAATRRLVLARGGALTRFSGLGGAHHALLNHHQEGRFECLELLDVLEYPEQTSAFGKASNPSESGLTASNTSVRTMFSTSPIRNRPISLQCGPLADQRS